MHVEFFAGPEGVVKEKALMVKRVVKNGYSILNADDKSVARMEKVAKGEVFTVGFGCVFECFTDFQQIHVVDEANGCRKKRRVHLVLAQHIL